MQFFSIFVERLENNQIVKTIDKIEIVLNL